MSDEETAFTFSVALGDDAEQRRRAALGRATLHVVFAAELLPCQEFDIAGPRSLAPIALPVGDPDAVVRELCPSFRIDVPDPFGGARPLTVDLRWDGLKALRPNELVASVPILNALLQSKKILDQGAQRGEAWLRAELARALGRGDWVDALLAGAPLGDARNAPPSAASTSAVSAGSAAPRAAAPASPLDALLDRVELPDTGAPLAPEPPARNVDTATRGVTDDSPLGAIVAAVARGAGSVPGGPRAEAPAPVVGGPGARLEAAFARVLRAIYRHPEFRRLERAYRGLELVSRRLARGAPVRVTVVPLEAGGSPDALAAWARRLPPAEAPDLVAVDARIDATEADLAHLDAWASLGEELQTVVALEAAPGLFGADSLEEVARVTRLWSSPDESATLPLRRAAARDNARWVVLGVNGLLGRAPYSKDSARLRELSFEEDDGSPGSWLVLSPVFGLAMLAIQSMTRAGHPFFLTGAESAITGLPLHAIREHGEVAAVPLAARFGSDTRRELARAGLSVFSCKLNSDVAFLERAPVLFRGADVVRGAKSPASVPASDQLAIGRLARALRAGLRAAPGRATGSQIRESVVAAVTEVFPNPPPVGPELTVELVQGGGVTLRVQPHRYAGIEFEEIELGSALSG